MKMIVEGGIFLIFILFFVSHSKLFSLHDPRHWKIQLLMRLKTPKNMSISISIANVRQIIMFLFH